MYGITPLPGEHAFLGSDQYRWCVAVCHPVEHYLYTQDRDYLRRIYPVLKGAARFFSSTTVQEPSHGWLVTAPNFFSGK